MFCSVCGQKVPDHSTFCSLCGASVAPTTYPNAQAQLQAQYQVQKNAIRQSEIQELNSVIQYFARFRGLFDEFTSVSSQVEHYGRGAKAALIVWGAIILTFGLLIFGGSGELAAGMVFLLPGSAMIVGGILMKVNNRKKYAYYTQRQQELAGQMMDAYDQYPNCPVGPEYCFPAILDLLMDILQSGRADTIKEAINLL